ncbi:MAG TPA: hypothetical protein VNO79_14710 [Actinomycetota bacterium]|nr:hypothetical protein [Actinomycetota bacterium]
MSGEELDLLFEGRVPHEGLEDVAALLGALPAALAEPPDEAVAQRHLAAIAEAAARTAVQAPVPGTRVEERRPRTSRRWIPMPVARRARVLIAGLAGALVLSLLTTGLAVAGVVELPEPARRALEAAGVPLPSQGGEDGGSAPSPDQLPEHADDTAFAVLGAIATHLPELREGTISGCEFGAAVAAAAGGGDGDTSHCTHGEEVAGEAPAGVARGAAGREASTGGRSVAEQRKAAAEEAREAALERRAAGRGMPAWATPRGGNVP